MKVSITVAIFFTGLATASPLLVREPQQFNNDDSFGGQPGDLSRPDPGFGPLDPGFAQPAPGGNGAQNPGPNDFSRPNSDSGPLDPDFAQPTPGGNGRKNSQGFSQQSCDAVRQNHGPELAATFGCNEFN